VDILNMNPKVLLVQLGGFALLLIVFKAFLFKPILGILDARRNEIDGRFADAEAQRKAADELRSEYQKHLADVEEEMRAKIAEALKQGQAMRDEIIADSHAKADSILTKAQEEITREKEKALTELKSKVADLTVQAAGKLIDKELDDAGHRQLVSRFIDDLDGART
jgi:F-type H+-transporting ATPase subunit b